ncbi:hypothetical protein CKO25_07750 [Thiocapsa imhoffii]|uniref:Uncharacterized protein n=1 Tax=Thiocapsa imhoffii TaxID=382777 RepID=A0A9X0WHA9_9GAMM|nr:hypothetical protein [Thiocapsa imhoffii]
MTCPLNHGSVLSVVAQPRKHNPRRLRSGRSIHDVYRYCRYPDDLYRRHLDDLYRCHPDDLYRCHPDDLYRRYPGDPKR